MNRVERFARAFDGWQQRHPPMAFTIAVVKKIGDDQAGSQVALLTYFVFVATFPPPRRNITMRGDRGARLSPEAASRFHTDNRRIAPCELSNRDTKHRGGLSRATSTCRRTRLKIELPTKTSVGNGIRVLATSADSGAAPAISNSRKDTDDRDPVPPEGEPSP